ncbi:hypothetical protein FACS189435_3160 [Bacteroidia bacterium]|nr:hypothetical protein FACS189435_3160 [Bacteroidia bacterium]
MDDLNGAAGCYGQPYTVKFPTNVTFNWWYNTSGAPLVPPIENPRTITNITTDTTFQIRPNAPVSSLYNRLGGFPKGAFTIKAANTSGTVATMRWTGLADSLWQNPANWVELKSGYEAPASFAPTTCVNVIIPSNVDYFPELIDSAYCADILMKDRAMLKNPHVLVYRNASVEIKLKPAERDRFVMWSAPLRNMYSGDYHYRVGSDPYWGDTFMNYFQRTNPDYPTSGQAVGDRFTATTGAVDTPLELGKAFNVKVTDNTITRDSLLRFPRKETTYKPIDRPQVSVLRDTESKFITHGYNLDASGEFNLPLLNMGVSSLSLVQVVNPYLAYLDFSKFAAGNGLVGYYIWSGDPNDGFVTIQPAMDINGNRIVASTSSSFYSSNPTLIPPCNPSSSK